MALKTDTVTLPAYWASALINGDFTGIESDAEAARIEAVMDEFATKGWHIVGCEDDARFTWSYRLYDPGADCSGGEVLDYDILYEDGETDPQLELKL